MKTLITGAPGTGKTTLVEYARQQGCMNFFDTDKVPGLCEWREYATGKVIGDVEKVEPTGGEQWYQTYGWYWKQDKMNKLLNSVTNPVVCGSADNVMDYYGAFDRIILLYKSREDIVHNLTRPERDQANGKDPAHHDRILRWQEKLKDSLKSFHVDLVSDNTVPAMSERVQNILNKNDLAKHMIRPASPEEFPQLLDIQIGCIRSLTDTYEADEIKVWVEYLEREGDDRYTSYSNQVFVNDANAIVGFVSWSQNDHAYSAAIECLYVKKRHRGQGIGQLLLQEAEANIAKGATIHVRSTLNARSFYESKEYEYIGDTISRAGFAIALLEKRVEPMFLSKLRQPD